MDYPKVPQEINNIVSDNVKLLAQLFPSAVKDGQVDLEALKEELGQFEEVGKEKYELTWAGKQDAKKKAQEDIYNRTLKYIEEDSKNPHTTENLYIEGDNLEVLKLLRQNYYGAIKMIYIDPPYNTGNDFIYNDKFAMDSKESDIEEGTRDDEGNPLQKNQQSSNRYHGNWLNMMYPRLKVAKDLLTDDGVIFISIDDNEVENLKKICSEIFGEENFTAQFVWVKKKKGSHLSKTTRSMTEYVLCYSKHIGIVELFGENAYSDKQQPLAKRTNSIKKLVFPSNAVLTTLDDGTYESKKYGEGTSALEFLNEFIVKDKVVITEISVNGPFVWTQAKLDKELELGTVATLSSKFGFNVLRSDQSEKIKRPSTLIDNKTNVGTNEDAYNEALEIFKEEGIMSYPKPISLIKYLINTITYFDKDSIILDFFSGSSTTAHAVMQLNAEDAGNRKFIMVQLPEETDEKSEAFKSGYKNICEIGKERIRRAGGKIKQEIETANSQLKIGEEPKQVPDIGFKVFRTADTNIKWNLYDELGQIDTDAMTHTPDLADFTQGYNDIDVVYEVMLRQKDAPLSSTLETLTDIGSRTYLYGSAYLVCLETEITETLIDKLAALDPLPIKFVFRDSAFKDDINLKDETFRRLKNLIERNSGLTKKTYTVEFI